MNFLYQGFFLPKSPPPVRPGRTRVRACRPAARHQHTPRSLSFPFLGVSARGTPDPRAKAAGRDLSPFARAKTETANPFPGLSLTFTSILSWLRARVEAGGDVKVRGVGVSPSFVSGRFLARRLLLLLTHATGKGKREMRRVCVRGRAPRERELKNGGSARLCSCRKSLKTANRKGAHSTVLPFRTLTSL